LLVWDDLQGECRHCHPYRYSEVGGPHNSHSAWGWLGFLLLPCATIAATVLAIMQAASFGSTPPVTYNQVLASQFGFQSGRTYPLIIGSRTGGSTGSVYGSFSFGFGSVAGSTVPSSSFPFSFTNQKGNSYMLDMPTSKTTFIKVANASDESLVLNLVNANTYTPQVCTQHRYHASIFIRAKYVDCTMPNPPVTITRQFGDYVQRYVRSVVVRITNADYQKLLDN
jgi:hypothetical protein